MTVDNVKLLEKLRGIRDSLMTEYIKNQQAIEYINATIDLISDSEVWERD